MSERRLKTRVALGAKDAELAWLAIEPVFSFPTPDADKPYRSPVWWDVTAGQLSVYAVTWVEREVCNGGFAQYFWNPAASFFGDAVEGFKKVGLPAYAEVLAEAGGVFPDQRPSLIRKERQEILASLALNQRAVRPEIRYTDPVPVLNVSIFENLNRRFYDLYDKGEGFYAALAAYIRSHCEEFFV